MFKHILNGGRFEEICIVFKAIMQLLTVLPEREVRSNLAVTVLMNACK